MQLRVVAYALAFAVALCAQDRPQMTWEGEVDGTAILTIRGKRFEIQDKDGRPLARERFRFNEKLPEIRQRVRLQVNQGRGFVRIVDQPRVENNYTLAVSIEDPQQGAGFYSIALYWDTADAGAGSDGGRLAWSGRVEDEATVVCRARQCRSEPVRGAPVMRERSKFSKPLPDHEVHVRLETPEGRGEVRLVEQPRESNGYAARVLIRDPQAGAGDYSFTLSWTDNPRSGAVSSLPGLTWSGRVEGVVRVAVQGGAALSEIVHGGPVAAERAVFVRPLPAGSNPNLEVRKQRGRGTVEIVEYPSNSNGYRLVFEIRDPGPGPDDYEIEVCW